MLSRFPLAIVFALAAGIAIATQQVVNSGLRNAVGSVWWAGLVSYLGGTAFMVGAIIATGTGVPSAAALGRISPAQWTGGILGGIYVVLSLFALPRLGVALVLAPVILGQMAASLAFDQFGWFGVPLHSITPTRVLGAVALVVGVLLIKAG